MQNSQQKQKPNLKGIIEIRKIGAYSTELIDSQVVAKLHVVCSERANGEFSYPVYYQDAMPIGSIGSNNMGVLPDEMTIYIHLFMNEIMKNYVKDGKIQIAVNVNTKTIYQIGVHKSGMTDTKEVGSCYYEIKETIKYEEKNKADRYVNPNLPNSIF